MTKSVNEKKLIEYSNKYLSLNEKSFLDRNGYLILKNNENYFRKNQININSIAKKIDNLISAEGNAGGWEGREEIFKKDPKKHNDPGSYRIANLLNKDKDFVKLISIPRVLGSLYYLMGGEFKFSASSLREPKKNEGLQNIHIDWKPRIKSEDSFECATCYIAIDDLNSANGSVSVIPGSHFLFDYPNEYIDISKKHPKEISLTLKSGDILILNSLLWHRGNLRTNNKRRRVLFYEYRKRDLPQGLNQHKYLSEATIKTLSNFEKYLLMVGNNYKKDHYKGVGAGKYYRKRYHSMSSAQVIKNLSKTENLSPK